MSLSAWSAFGLTFCWGDHSWKISIQWHSFQRSILSGSVWWNIKGFQDSTFDSWRAWFLMNYDITLSLSTVSMGQPHGCRLLHLPRSLHYFSSTSVLVEPVDFKLRTYIMSNLEVDGLKEQKTGLSLEKWHLVIFQSSNAQFHWTSGHRFSVFGWQEWNLVRLSIVCSPAVSRFNVLCILGWFSAHLWPLSSTRHFHPNKCHALEVFWFSQHSL